MYRARSVAVVVISPPIDPRRSDAVGEDSPDVAAAGCPGGAVSSGTAGAAAAMAARRAVGDVSVVADAPPWL